MQAVADALSLLANIVMAWNTRQMQSVLDRWANRRQWCRQSSSGGWRRRAWKGSTCAGLPLPAGALRGPDPAVTNRGENKRRRLRLTPQTGAQRPIGGPTETHCLTSTCVGRRANPRQCSLYGGREPSLLALKSNGPPPGAAIIDNAVRLAQPARWRSRTGLRFQLREWRWPSPRCSRANCRTSRPSPKASARTASHQQLCRQR